MTPAGNDYQTSAATPARLSNGQCAALACLLEVAAPKPGNVHRAADFEQMNFGDFLISAVGIVPAFDSAAAGTPLGETIESAVRATQLLVNKNTNLGTILLLAPLACVPLDRSLQMGLPEVLARLTTHDAQCVYKAIRHARPGGLGEVEQYDVAEDPPDDLIVAMRAAAERDLVARQYVNKFAEVFGLVVPQLLDGQRKGWSVSNTIVHAHVQLMSRFPDSLIARKCGQSVAADAARQAAFVLQSGAPGDEAYERALADLDFWLRADHNRRNPGTTADLIAAGLFVVLREGLLLPNMAEHVNK